MIAYSNMISQLYSFFLNSPYKLVKINQGLNKDIIENNKTSNFIFIDASFKESIAAVFLENTDLQSTEVTLVSSDKEQNHIIRLLKYIPNCNEDRSSLIIIEEEILKGNKIVARDEVQFFFYKQKQLEIKPKKINHKYRDVVFIYSSDRIDLIKMKDIVFCMSDGRYTTFFTSDGKKYVASKNLGEYEKELDKRDFFRIHRSYIVNMNFIVSINKKNGIFCELANGTSLPISVRKQAGFSEFMGL